MYIIFTILLMQASYMQTVSERLSQHVLSNYSKFVAGVTEVASVERDLQVSICMRLHPAYMLSQPQSGGHAWDCALLTR